MALNIFIFLFIALLWGLFYYFPLRRVTARADFKPLRVFLIAFGVVFLGNAFFAGLGVRSLWAASVLPPVVALEAFKDTADGDSVILEGVVSIDNPMVTANYVAYAACEDEETCTLDYTPENLLITIEDGDVAIVNTDFSGVAWPSANNPPEPFYSANYLAPGEPVIVVGQKAQGLAMEVEIVYVGTHAAFIHRAKQHLIVPVVMTLLNLAGAASVIILSLCRWREVKP